MNVHEKTEISHIRIFDKERSYSNKDNYRLILTCHYLGDDEVFLSGAKGNLDRKVCIKIKDYLKEKGIKTVRFERSVKSILVNKEFEI